MDGNLNYLAGLFDGEGYVGLTIHKPAGVVNFIPRVTISNSNTIILDHAGQILKSLNIAFHISARKRPQDLKWKKVSSIECSGFKRAWKFLWIVEPLLVGKRPQAQMTMAFIWSRLRSGTRKIPYSDEQTLLYYALKELNRRGPEILREYTPKAIELTAKMYSELRTKGAEVTEMMTRQENSYGYNSISWL